jgi:prolyl-tRNA synthetase
MIGTLIMAHGDDDGVIIPPRVAPQQIVILQGFKAIEVGDPNTQHVMALRRQRRRGQDQCGQQAGALGQLQGGPQLGGQLGQLNEGTRFG